MDTKVLTIAAIFGVLFLTSCQALPRWNPGNAKAIVVKDHDVTLAMNYQGSGRWQLRLSNSGPEISVVSRYGGTLPGGELSLRRASGDPVAFTTAGRNTLELGGDYSTAIKKLETGKSMKWDVDLREFFELQSAFGPWKREYVMDVKIRFRRNGRPLTLEATGLRFRY